MELGGVEEECGGQRHQAVGAVFPDMAIGFQVELDGTVVSSELLMHDDRQAPDRKPYLGLADPGPCGRLFRQFHTAEVDAHLVGPEEEAAEVLITLLGIHQSVAARVGAVDIGAVSLPHVGVVDVDEPVAARSYGLLDQPVVGRVRSDEAEHAAYIEGLGRDFVGPPASRWCGALNRARRQVGVHPLRDEHVRSIRSEGLHGPVHEPPANIEGDSPVRRAIGEETVHQLAAGPAGLAGGRIGRARHLLDHAACKQAAHGVGHQVHFGSAGFEADQLDEVVQPLRGPLKVELLWNPDDRGAEGGSGVVVEAMHPNGRRGYRAIVLRRQIRLLITADQELVPLIVHQPQERAFELVKGRYLVATDADMRGTAVESVERIISLLVHAARRAGVPAQIDNGLSLRHVACVLPGR
ncbi:hypothetical protein C5746_42900 [Streptomyces atratus]|uniref:Uncharacterized protein n=1 Tax=Streptomyces atratus TaxID=1893 RepID=A0A2Z5JPX0_STRAR|nr:hypothetical protein C5746_00335 [Streptomyces atratus]AXE82467.1 hypothetical protein C5746_42900 [Streptomyces atratus]